jgi:outer membrane protein TolC
MIGVGLEVMGPDFSMMESSFAWPIVPSVSMTVPIWRSKSNAIRREADFRVEESAARYDAALSALTAERAEAALILRQADETVTLYRDRMLPRSIELADLILLEYSTGKRMADEVIMARRETLELSMTLEMAIAERNTALARLQSLYPTLEP